MVFTPLLLVQTASEGCTFTQTSGQHKVSNDEEKTLSVCIPLFPVFSFSVFPHWPSHPVFGLQGLTGSTSKHVSFLVGTFWQTSWKADGSPVLSGQPPDGEHTDLQKAVHALSFSRLQELPVFLPLPQTPFANFVLYLLPTRDTYFTTFMCFPSLKTISAASSVQQSGFALKVQGDFFSLSQVLIPLENPTQAFPCIMWFSSSKSKYLRHICKN